MTSIALRHPSLTLSYVGLRRLPSRRQTRQSLLARARIRFSARRFRRGVRSLLSKPEPSA